MLSAVKGGFNKMVGKAEPVVPGTAEESGDGAQDEEEELNGDRGTREVRPTISQPPTSSAEKAAIKEGADKGAAGGALLGFGDEEEDGTNDAAGEQSRNTVTDSKKNMVDTGLAGFIIDHVYDDGEIPNYTPSFRR